MIIIFPGILNSSTSYISKIHNFHTEKVYQQNLIKCNVSNTETKQVQNEKAIQSEKNEPCVCLRAYTHTRRHTQYKYILKNSRRS